MRTVWCPSVCLSEGTGAGRTVKGLVKLPCWITSHLIGRSTGSRLLEERLLADGGGEGQDKQPQPSTRTLVL